MNWGSEDVKAERLVAMVGLLRRPDLTTIERLSSDLGISRRTVLRDLDWLTDAGFEVEVVRGRYGGVRLAPGSRVDLDTLTQDELEQLRVLGLDDVQLAYLGLADQRRLLRRRIGARKSVHTMALSDLVVVDNSAWFDSESPLAMDGLLDALRERRRWYIDYQPTGSADDVRFVVDPYGLLAKAGRWYLVADVDARPRLFNLGRLHMWTLTTQPARHRIGESLTSVAEVLISTTRNRSSILVSAVFPASEHSRALRMLGATVVRAEALDDGFVRLTIGCSHLQEVRALLPFVDRIRDVRPMDARLLLVRILREGLADHRELSSDADADT